MVSIERGSTTLLRQVALAGDAPVEVRLGGLVAAKGAVRDANGRPVAGAAPLVFLDVEMPEMSGIELVRTMERRPAIVLVTGKAQYAVEAFDVAVADYLLKPVAPPRLRAAVERARTLLDAPHGHDATVAIVEDHEAQAAELDERRVGQRAGGTRQRLCGKFRISTVDSDQRDGSGSVHAAILAERRSALTWIW
mgnify:CR=1 FL=1